MAVSFFEPRTAPRVPTFIHCRETAPPLKRSHSFSGYKSYALEEMSKILVQQRKCEQNEWQEVTPRLPSATPSIRPRSRTSPLALNSSTQYETMAETSDDEHDGCNEEVCVSWPDTDSEENDWCRPHAEICPPPVLASGKYTENNASDGSTLHLATLLSTPAPAAVSLASCLVRTSMLPDALDFSPTTSSIRATDISGLPTLLVSQTRQPRSPPPCKSPVLCSPNISNVKSSVIDEKDAPSMPPSSKPNSVTKARSEAHGVLSQAVTTLMIRNLPSNLSQAEFLAELDASGFQGTYDFAYLPQSFDKKENKGFAFINFTSTAIAGVFVGQWHQQHSFSTKSSRLPVNISIAAIQGFEANMQKWELSRLRRIRNPQLRPFVVSKTQEQNRALSPLISTVPCGHTRRVKQE